MFKDVQASPLYKPVSREFREELLRLYPALKHKPYMSLFRSMLFFDGDKPQVMSHMYLALITGKGNNWRKFNSGEFLKAYQRDVSPDFAWSDYGYGAAREVVCTGISPEAIELVEAYREHERDVFLETGSSVGDRHMLKRLYADNVAYIEQLAVEKGMSEQARKMLAHHNTALTTNEFRRRVKANIGEAERVAQAFKESPAVYASIKETLEDVKVFPMPLLKPVEKADRLFTHFPALITIKREVRQALTSGWWELDLRNAQFAINAAVWDIPELTELLERNGSVWDVLLADVDDSHRSAIKEAIKPAVYSLLYGASTNGIRRELEANLTVLSYSADDFFNHWIVRLLLKKRDEMMRRVMKEDFRNPLDGSKLRGTPMSRLACLAQAYELAIIYSVYELQETTNQFHVTLYQYDGLTVAFRDERTREKTMRRIEEAVEEAGRRFGIVARLDWTRL